MELLLCEHKTTIYDFLRATTRPRTSLSTTNPVVNAAVLKFAVKSKIALCFQDIKTIVYSWDQKTKTLNNRIAICIDITDEDVEQSCYQRRADWV